MILLPVRVNSPQKGVVARALPWGFVLCDCPVRLHITQTHLLEGFIKIWGENNTHEFHPNPLP